MAKHLSQSELDLIFGEESRGATLKERASDSRSLFVRGQVQLAPFSQVASGRVLTALQAVEEFGGETVLRAIREGSASLISNAEEPATTLKARRLELGLDVTQVARRAHVSDNDIVNAETPGTRVPIRILERIAQTLALDERTLGYEPNTGRDEGLGVRLREMGAANSVPLSSSVVLSLAEAAWVIARQQALQKSIGESDRENFPQPSYAYQSPVYRAGYDLAARTRALLGLEELVPIESVRHIVEDEFHIPLVQLKMGPRLAGATIANTGIRGIVINEEGHNSNVWVRRMTMAHELGHLLWDPDERLKAVRVDAYDDIENTAELAKGREPEEVRANAFAIAFLAPPAGVQRIVNEENDFAAALSRTMSTYGISLTAAKHHLRNVANVPFSQYSSGPEPDEQWIALENLTLDFFPIGATPLSRRGRFGWLVAKAVLAGLITPDSAASYLSVPVEDVTQEALMSVLALGQPETDARTSRLWPR